jgi:hypothetical protein
LLHLLPTGTFTLQDTPSLSRRDMIISGIIYHSRTSRWSSKHSINPMNFAAMLQHIHPYPEHLLKSPWVILVMAGSGFLASGQLFRKSSFRIYQEYYLYH